MNKHKFSTAVSKSPLLLTIVLAPLLCLGWVTQLMAQDEPADRPDFVITEPVELDLPRANSYQTQFVGLLLDADKQNSFPVNNLLVKPVDETAYIELLPTKLDSLAEEDFYISLVVDTSGSMGVPRATTLSDTEVITGLSNLDRIKNELDRLIANAPENAHFSVVGFNGQISQERFVAFTDDKDVLRDRIAQLQTTNGSTCLNDVAWTAVNSLNQRPQNSRRAIILFTDGVDEVTRDQPEQCSQSHSFQDAITAAANAEMPIPLHTVNYPYGDGETLTDTKPLTSSNQLLIGLSLDETNLSEGFERILDSFTNQWLATIELYTPDGTFELQLTPQRTDGIAVEPQILTYTAVHEHYPAALLDSIVIEDLVYDEVADQFVITYGLCPDGLGADQAIIPFCKPELVEEIDVLIEDLFTYEITTTSRIPGDSPTIHVTYTVKPEHYYLVRLTARNDLTSDNFHPRAEAVFAYQPQLEFSITSASPPRLSGFSLYPDLTLAVWVTRTQNMNPIPAASVLNGRPFFHTIRIQQPQPKDIQVSGYLLYTGEDSRQELYPLVLPEALKALTDKAKPYAAQSAPPAPAPEIIPIVFPQGAGGGYTKAYDLFLTVKDETDGVGQTLKTETEIAPGVWYGSILSQVRQILANPLMYVVAILASLLLLGLIWFVVWLARRSVKEEPATAPAVTRKTDPLPAQLYADASPDKTVHHQHFDLPGERPFHIGRDHENELPVRADENMANLHAQIRKMGHDYYIISCDADRATYINNQEIITNAPFRIQTGDKIRLGPHTRFTFTAPREAQEIKENGHH